MPIQRNGKTYLTNDEAAHMMLISGGTLANWRSTKRRGRPPATYFGGKVFYDEAAVLQWIDLQQEKVKPAAAR